MLRPIMMLSAAAAVLAAEPAAAQVKGTVGAYSDARISASVLEPRKLDLAEDQLAARLRVPDGFRVSVFATGLVNPRMLAVGPDGALYATRRSVGDVIRIADADGDGKADAVERVASRPGMHGIAIDRDTVYLATVRDVYRATIGADSRFGDLTRIINDLPDAGQHPNRTLAVGPDGMLYISVGSTCNACDERNPENATILRASPDGKGRTILASGLRNTIGFGWHPESGALIGFDHGIDWLGDEAQIEEVNVIERGKSYGWPYIYGMGSLNPQDNPPEGISLEDWKQKSTDPVVGYTAHSAPMQMAFVPGGAFGADWRGDAVVAMRGSWNRRPPSGYEIVRLRFEKGRPTAVEPFLTGFLGEDDGRFAFSGRPTGVAFGRDGSLFVADDTVGVIYRVSRSGAAATAARDAGPAAGATGAGEAAAKAGAETQPRPLAIEAVEATGDRRLEVTSTRMRAGEPIPETFSAYGDDVSPPIAWSAAPEGTRSFVVIVDDPDAPVPGGLFNHWVVYDIPPDAKSLREGLPTTQILQDPKGLKQGMNSRGSSGYFGMKPPVGDPPHRYHFQVFALDRKLELKPGADRQAVLDAMKGHVLAEGELVGTFERPRPVAGR